MPKFEPRPTGHKGAWRLARNGQLFFCGAWHNFRKAHCKVCGGEIKKGLGERWLKFGPNNDWAFQEVYLCQLCSAFWDSVKFGGRDFEPYLSNKNPEQRRLIFEYISSHWEEF